MRKQHAKETCTQVKHRAVQYWFKKSNEMKGSKNKMEKLHMRNRNIKSGKSTTNTRSLADKM